MGKHNPGPHGGGPKRPCGVAVLVWGLFHRLTKYVNYIAVTNDEQLTVAEELIRPHSPLKGEWVDAGVLLRVFLYQEIVDDGGESPCLRRTETDRETVDNISCQRLRDIRHEPFERAVYGIDRRGDRLSGTQGEHELNATPDTACRPVSRQTHRCRDLDSGLGKTVLIDGVPCGSTAHRERIIAGTGRGPDDRALGIRHAAAEDLLRLIEARVDGESAGVLRDVMDVVIRRRAALETVAVEHRAEAVRRSEGGVLDSF